MKDKVESSFKYKKILLLVIIAILSMVVIGATYAFFNYAKNGATNTIATGRIVFNTSQNSVMNLSNAFPIDITNGIPNDPENVSTITLNISGDTTYEGGIEYLITATDVVNTIGSNENLKTIPINIEVSQVTGLGSSSNTYYDTRYQKANSIYKVEASEAIADNDHILVGYIKSGQTGVNGNITIRACVDASKVAITDTYDGTASLNMGTTSEWVGDRLVVTTAEWNNLNLSFKLKAEANEGIWVPDPEIAPMELDGLNGEKNIQIVENKSRTLSIITAGTGAISVVSSDSSIATYSLNGDELTVNALSPGRVTITLTQAPSGPYTKPSIMVYNVEVLEQTQEETSITLANENVDVTYNGSSGENAYSYNGNGAISCESSDTTKVTCSVDTTNGKIIVTPILPTTTPVTITVSGEETENFLKPSDTTFTVNVLKMANRISLTCASLTYTGNNQNLISAKSATVGDVYIAKSSLDASNYSTTGSTALSGAQGKSAGSYTVYAYNPGNEYYEAASSSVSCSIASKITISFSLSGSTATATCQSQDDVIATMTAGGTTNNPNTNSKSINVTLSGSSYTVNVTCTSASGTTKTASKTYTKSASGSACGYTYNSGVCRCYGTYTDSNGNIRSKSGSVSCGSEAYSDSTCRSACQSRNYFNDYSNTCSRSANTCWHA